MNTMIIGIAGPSAGGKTSVTNLICERIEVGHALVIRYDDYYKDQSHLTFEERVKTNYDHPNAFDTDLLIEHIKDLKGGKPIQKPIYDFTEHNRKKETEKVMPRDVIIIEGIFSLLDERLRELLDTKVYVYEDSDICFIRRLKRDTAERGRTLENVIDQYMQTVKPMQEQFIEPTKKYADVIILRGKTNSVAIEMIADNIARFLKSVKRKRVG